MLLPAQVGPSAWHSAVPSDYNGQTSVASTTAYARDLLEDPCLQLGAVEGPAISLIVHGICHDSTCLR